MNGLRILLNAHHHIWRDKTWPFDVRRQTCQILWDKVLELCSACGNVSTVEPLTGLAEPAPVPHVTAKQ